MVAAEMVQHLRPHVQGLLLLSTCRSNAGVPWLYRTAW